MLLFQQLVIYTLDTQASTAPHRVHTGTDHGKPSTIHSVPTHSLITVCPYLLT